MIALGKGGKIAMHEWIRTMRSRAAIPLMVDARQVIAGLVYLVAYVALDRVSFSESYAQLGITPWSPSTGLSFVLILLFGRSFVPDESEELVALQSLMLVLTRDCFA